LAAKQTITPATASRETTTHGQDFFRASAAAAPAAAMPPTASQFDM
jgi:hypothetical protein